MSAETTGLAGSRVLVTGGQGFLGGHVLARLGNERCEAVFAPSHAQLDLCRPDAVAETFRMHRPQVVVHLAARVGGIGANQRHPATFWHDNLLMGVNVLDACRAAAVRRLVVVGTVCAYPNLTPVPFHESDLWNGFPEATNAPYGVAKRALATGLDAYRREFGLGGAFLLPANLYGPGDDFDYENSHVIPAIIRRCVEAVERKDPEIRLWGTGTASREFLYVDDAAAAIVAAGSFVDDPAPINLGTGREIRIGDLAVLIARATGFDGEIRWDATRPDGQPRRALDTSMAKRRLGWEATTSLEDGLAGTVRWYRQARGAPAPNTSSRR